MSHDAWAAIALESHPFTVRRLHELYIDAGVDVITTNTYEEFVARAQRWVSEGVQVIGGCCGVELEYIRPLRGALPERLAA